MKICAFLTLSVLGSVLCADTLPVLDMAEEGDCEVSSLAAYSGVVNTGDSLRTLTITPTADESFAGTISGKVRLVKKGVGFLRLTGDNSYTGGTRIELGRLIAAHEHAFGDTNTSVEVIVDCQQTAMASNKVTCVVFDKATSFGYPITCSAWTTPAAGPSGTSGQRQYNIAVLQRSTTLTGKITGGSVSIHLGGLGWSDNPAKATGTGAVTVSGDIDCQAGTVNCNARGQTIALTGLVRTLGCYSNVSGTWPVIWSLGKENNTIGVIDVGGGAATAYSLTADRENALGGARIYSSARRVVSDHIVVNANQTVESLRLGTASEGYAPGDISDAAARHYIKSTAAATVTIAATANHTNDWSFQDDSVSTALSVIYAPTDDHTMTWVGQNNTMHGSLEVRRGTIEANEWVSFPNLSRLTIAAGATVRFARAEPLAPFAETELVMAEGATLAIPSGSTLAVASFKYGDTYWTSGAHAFAGGTLYVASKPDVEAVTALWTGAGSDTSFATAQNWESETCPDFAQKAVTAQFASGGTRATVAAATRVAGLAFGQFGGATDTAFALDGAGDGMLILGEGGIDTTRDLVGEQRRTYDFNVPICPVADQAWHLCASNSLTIHSLRSNPYISPTITISATNNVTTKDVDSAIVTFIGSGDSDFAGDLTFEPTRVPTRVQSVSVLAVGTEPFGSGAGTVRMNARPSNSTGNAPYLFVSNAVISKSFVTGSHYPADIKALDGTTNVFNGTVSALSKCYASGLYVGKGSRLVFNGPCSFANARTGGSADVSFYIHTTASKQADIRQGSIVFNGQVSYPRTMLIRAGLGEIAFNAPNNEIDGISFTYSDDKGFTTVTMGADYAFTNGYTDLTLPTDSSTASRYVIFDLQGHDQWFGSITNVCSTNCQFISKGGAATLRLTQGKDITYRGTIGAGVTLLKDGANTLTFDHKAAFAAGSTLVIAEGACGFANGSVASRGVNLRFEGGTLAVAEETRVGKVWYKDGNGDLQPVPRGRYQAGDGTVLGSLLTGAGCLNVRNSDIPVGVLIRYQ